MTSHALLECRQLCAWWGHAQIIFNLDLSLHASEVLALVGPNGAGKSTTLKALMGLTSSRSGSIHLNGQDLSEVATHRAAEAGLGYVPEERRIFTELTVLENLKVGAYKSRQTAPADRHWDFPQIFALFPQLEPMLHRSAAHMSGGEQQMLTIARTLLGNPRVLLLDEPSEGVAPIVVEQLAHALRTLKSQGVSMLLCEQNQAFVEFVSDRQYALHQGQIKPSALSSHDAAQQNPHTTPNTLD